MLSLTIFLDFLEAGVVNTDFQALRRPLNVTENGMTKVVERGPNLCESFAQPNNNLCQQDRTDPTKNFSQLTAQLRPFIYDFNGDGTSDAQQDLVLLKEAVRDLVADYVTCGILTRD
jgi:hypothetical protein